MAMATKLGRMVAFLEELLIIKPCNAFDHVVSQVHLTNKKHISMATKICKMMTYLDGLLPKRPHGHMTLWLRVVARSCDIISPLVQCQWPCRVLIYLEGLISLYSYVLYLRGLASLHERLKTYLLTPQYLWSPNLARWWHTMKKRSHP